MLSDHPHTRLCDARNPKKIFQWVANFHYDQILQQLIAVPNPGQVLIVWVVCGIMASLVVIM